MISWKNFSLKSFFIGTGIGLVVGGLLVGVFAQYLINSALEGSGNGAFLAERIDQIRAGVAQVTHEREATIVYGKVVSIGGGTLVLDISRSDGMKQFTFTYTNDTTIVYLANDDASTEVPLSSDAILAGEGLQVFLNEPVGSVANQHAAKIIRI